MPGPRSSPSGHVRPGRRPRYLSGLVTRNSPFAFLIRTRRRRRADAARGGSGLELFFTESPLRPRCHGGPMFEATSRFHVLGVPQEGGGKDVLSGDDTGREEHTLNRGTGMRSALQPSATWSSPPPTCTTAASPRSRTSAPLLPTTARSHATPPSGTRSSILWPDPIGLDERRGGRRRGLLLRALTDPGTALDPACSTCRPAARRAASNRRSATSAVKQLHERRGRWRVSRGVGPQGWSGRQRHHARRHPDICPSECLFPQVVCTREKIVSGSNPRRGRVGMLCRFPAAPKRSRRLICESPMQRWLLCVQRLLRWR